MSLLALLRESTKKNCLMKSWRYSLSFSYCPFLYFYLFQYVNVIRCFFFWLFMIHNIPTSYKHDVILNLTERLLKLLKNNIDYKTFLHHCSRSLFNGLTLSWKNIGNIQCKLLWKQTKPLYLDTINKTI